MEEWVVWFFHTHLRSAVFESDGYHTTITGSARGYQYPLTDQFYTVLPSTVCDSTIDTGAWRAGE